MKRWLVLPAMLGLFLVSSLAWAAAPNQMGLLVYASGLVSERTGDSAPWAAARLNYPLASGDELLAANGARAELQIGSSDVRMDSATQLLILALDSSAVELRLLSGSLDVRLRDLASGQLFQITSPDSSVSLLKPGSYRLDVETDGSSRIIVRDGLSEVTSGSSAVAVQPQQMALVSSGGAAAVLVEAAPQLDAFDQWNVDRDQWESRLASTSYVSPWVAGCTELFVYGRWEIVAGLGPVWLPPVPAGWSPFMDGEWAWVPPWGWIWIDDEPWGFAPFHYGKWVMFGGGWVWVPGPLSEPPVFVRATVVVTGGSVVIRHSPPAVVRNAPRLLAPTVKRSTSPGPILDPRQLDRHQQQLRRQGGGSDDWLWWLEHHRGGGQ